MNKASVAWLILRTTGLGLLLVSLHHSPSVIYSLYFLFSYSQPIVQEGSTITLPLISWTPITNLLVYFCLSMYFLFFGKTAHKWLNRE